MATTTTGPPLLNLPKELQDMILEYCFIPTEDDYPGTRRAQLRIQNDDVILKRTDYRSPPRWKECRKVMTLHPILYQETMALLYGSMRFTVRIRGSDQNPSLPRPERNRITSEYPIGSTSRVVPHLKAIQVVLEASTLEELQGIRDALRNFVSATVATDVRYIAMYFPNARMLNTHKGQRLELVTDIARSLGKLGSRSGRQVEVYDQNQALPKYSFERLLRSIGGFDSGHIVGSGGALEGPSGGRA